MPYMIIHFFPNLAVSQNFFLKNSQKHASKASCVILNIFFSTHQVAKVSRRGRVLKFKKKTPSEGHFRSFNAISKCQIGTLDQDLWEGLLFWFDVLY